MKIKKPLNTNTAIKAPDTLSVFREHYLQIAQSRAQMNTSFDIKSWMQYKSRIDQILFQN